MSEVSVPKGNMLVRVLLGTLGLGLVVAAVLYATQVGKTNDANTKVGSLTIDLGTANNKISSLNSELTASKDQVTTLTADLGTANGKVTSLSSDLGAANAKVTSLTSDLATANGRVTSLTASLSTANADNTKIRADLAAANANITKLSTDLASANANVTKLSTDLAAANANVVKLTADLAAANASVAKLTADVAKLTADLKSTNETAKLFAAAIAILADPRHFNSVQELNEWLASDDTNTNTIYAAYRNSEKSYILQVKALREGLLLPAAIRATSNGTVYYNNVAIVGGSVYAVNVLTDEILLEGTTTPYQLHPLPLE